MCNIYYTPITYKYENLSIDRIRISHVILTSNSVSDHTSNQFTIKANPNQNKLLE